MINTFTLVLISATCITGLIWIFENFNGSYIKNVFYYIWSRVLKNRFMLKNGTIEKENGTIEKERKKINVFQMILNYSRSYASIFPVLLLILIFRSFLFEPFHIPSGSMMPTLLIGDFILVKKFSYGLKNPITQSTWIKRGHPERGDVVVFKYPMNPTLNYIKRVVGLPGDHIQYDWINKKITITQKYNNEERFPITYSKIKDSNFFQNVNIKKNGTIDIMFYQCPPDHCPLGNLIKLVQCEELLGERQHSILIVPNTKDILNINDHISNDWLSEWVVPKGEYFMMGDNRDNSADSRYWGCVPEKNLVGQATMIWMSLKKKEGPWPINIRFNRIGKVD